MNSKTVRHLSRALFSFLLTLSILATTMPPQVSQAAITDASMLDTIASTVSILERVLEAIQVFFGDESVAQTTSGGNQGNGGNHPYLLFTDAELVGIRAKVNDTSTINNKFWLALKSRCDGLKSEVQNSVFPIGGFGSGYSTTRGYNDSLKVTDVAVCAAIANDASMMNAVKAALTRFSNYRPITGTDDQIELYDVGAFSQMIIPMDIAYDSLASDLTTRNKLEDLLYAQAMNVVNTNYANMVDGKGKGNHWMGYMSMVYGTGTLLKGYTRYGSGLTPAQLVTKGETMMKYFLDNDFDPDGSEYEPYNYTQSVVITNLYLWHRILKNYSGIDLARYRVVDGKPILQRFGEYTMHVTFPDLEHSIGFGDGRDKLKNRLPYVINALDYNDGVAMWYWKEIDRRTVGALTPTNILRETGGYADEELVPIALWAREIPEIRPNSAPAGIVDNVKVYGALGTTRGDWGSGHIMMRTGFEGVNDIQLASQAGDYGAFHGHSDEGGYILNAFGARFLTDTFFNTGGYDSSGYYYLQSSKAHNGVMACSSDLTECHASGYRLNSNPQIQLYSAPDAVITHNERSGSMYHVAADLGAAYRRHGEDGLTTIDPDTITDADRHFVFVRKSSSDGFYVVIDDLSSSAARRWQQRQHYSEDVTPTLPGGNKLTLTKTGTSNKMFIDTVYSNQAMTMRGPTTLNCSGGGCEKSVLDRYVELSTNTASNRFVQVTLIYPSASGTTPVVGSPIVSGNVLRIVVDGRTVTYDMSTKTVTMSEGSTIPPAACSDGLDNDGDTKIDFGTGTNNDPGCTSATDTDEYNAPIATAVACTPTTQSVYTGGTATLTASGGTGTFAWTASGGSPASGSGATFATTYTTTGTKTVSVVSGTTNAQCSVSVSTPPVTTTACSDGIDGADGEDTLIDMADPGCVAPTDTSESNPTPVSTKFVVGNNVRVSNTAGANVRMPAGGVSVDDGTGQPSGATGTVVGGPKFAVYSGVNYWWWNVDYTNAPDGWSIQDGLTVVTAPPPAACSDGLDNDGDGKIDYGTGTNNDPGCTSNTDTDEYNAPIATAVACTPTTQSVYTGGTATLTASGGTGSFSWTATGGTPSTGSGATFATTYTTTGTKTVSVTSGTTASCSVSVTTPPVSGGGNNGNGGNHPYLVFTDADLIGIRARLNDTSSVNNKYWLAFKTDCDSQKSAVQNSVFPATGFGSGYSVQDGFVDAPKVRDVAICAAITNDASMMTAVKAALTRFSNYSAFPNRPTASDPALIDLHELGVFSPMVVAMDIAYDSFTTSSDLSIRNRLEDLFYAEAVSVSTDYHWGDLSQPRGKGNKWYHAVGSVYGAGTLLKNYTRYGSGPTPASLITKGEAMMKYFLNYDIDPKGSEYEPYNYTQSVVTNNMYLWNHILNNYAGVDLFRYRVIDGKPVLQRFGEYTMHITAPNLNNAAGFGDGTNILSKRASYAMNAAYYNDGTAMWYWNEMDRRRIGAMTTANIRADYETDDLLTIMLWGKSIPEVRPSSAPGGELDFVRVHNATGANAGAWGSGDIFMRTGFEQTNDIQLVAQVGNHGGFHGHSDEGGYILSAFGVPFIDDIYFNGMSGGYDGALYKYMQSSRAHNPVMACNSTLSSCHSTGYQHNSNPTLQGSSPQVASITQNERVGNMYHVAGDLGGAYRSHGEFADGSIDPDTITDADRHFVFARKSNSDGFYVVIDDLASSVARRWQQRQHYSGEVTPSLPGGNNITLTKTGTTNKVFINTVYTNQAMSIASPVTLSGSFYGQTKVYDRYIELSTNNSSNRFIQFTLLYPSASGVAPTVPTPTVSGSTIRLTIEGKTIVYDQSTKTVTMSEGSTTPPAACADGLDNDGDGKTDYPADPGCSSSTDTDEYNAPIAACSDGLDNDGDGKIDYGTATSNDPGCTSNTDTDEYNAPIATAVACTPTTQSVYTGGTATLTASGGTGSFSWTATGGTPSTGSGATFATTYTTTGTKTVSVTSGTTASCSVSVSTAPTTGGGNNGNGGNHPYLVFTDAEIPAIRTRVNDTTSFNYAYWQQTKSACSTSLSRLRDSAFPVAGPSSPQTFMEDAENLRNLAICAVLDANSTTRSTYMGVVRDALIRISGYSTFGVERTDRGYIGEAQYIGRMYGGLAVAYDIAFDSFTTSAQLTARGKFETLLYRDIVAAQLEYKDEVDLGSDHHKRTSNKRANFYGSLLTTGLVLKYYTGPAQALTINQLISIGGSTLTEVIDWEFDREGAAYEAVNYQPHVVAVPLFWFSEIYSNVLGVDLFQRSLRGGTPILQRYMDFTMYMLYPTLHTWPSFDDSNTPVFNPPSQTGLNSLVAHYVTAVEHYGDGVAAWYLKKFTDTGKKMDTNDAMAGTLWGRNVAPIAPNSSGRLKLLEVYNHAPESSPDMHGTGHIFMRTGFENPKDIQLVAQAGDIGGAHGHGDQGGYVLNAFGTMFLTDFTAGNGYGSNPMWPYFQSSKAHNGVLACTDTLSYCGGSLYPQDPDSTRRFPGHDLVSTIPTIFTNGAYDRVTMDMTESYQLNSNNQDVSDAKRHIVFIREGGIKGYFVIIDDITRSVAKRWQQRYHYSVNWNETEVNPTIVSNTKYELTKKGATSPKLFIQTVYPTTGITAADAYGPSSIAVDGAVATDDTDKDRFIQVTTNGSSNRFVQVSVLYPSETGTAPTVTPTISGNTISVLVDGRTVTYNQGDKTISVNTGTTPPTYACNNSLDDDADGRIDYPADTGCASATDNDEYNAPPTVYICSDGLDNDSDGKTDFGTGTNNDPGCTSATDNDEFNLPPTSAVTCSPASQSVNTGSAASFTASGGTGTFAWTATGGAPTSGSGTTFSTTYSSTGTKTVTVTSNSTSAQCSVSVTTPPILAQCADSLDNDSDGKIDFGTGVSNDPGCTSNTDNDEYNAPSGGSTTFSIGQTVTPTFQLNVRANPGGTLLGVHNPGDTGVIIGGPVSAAGYWYWQIDYATAPDGWSAEDFLVAVTAPPAACADGLDNDGDGKIDYPADPGCTSTTDTDEYNAPPPVYACSDSLDNDSDGKIDYGTATSNDPGCTSATDTDEFNLPPASPVACSPTAQSVITGQSATFTASNGNGTYTWTATGGSPASGSGATFSTTYSNTGTKSVTVTSNSTSASCSVSVTTPPPVAALCANSIDDDADGKVDMADYGCVLATDNDESNPTPVSTKFVVGNAVRVTTTTFLNVRDIPGGTDIGDQLDNQTGTVIAGPKYTLFSGTPFWWWNIDFASGADGWTVQDGLTAVTAPPAACADGLDNDGDGKIDYPTDPGCSSAMDIDEYDVIIDPVYACSDSLDNDSDGKIDLADLGCSSSTDNDEYNAPLVACADGLDNDSDGKIDYPADFGCTSATDTSEINPVSTADIKAKPASSGTYTGGAISINTGTTASIQWSSTNAGSCTVVSNPSGTSWTGTSGTQTTPTLTQATTYALTCYQSGAVASTDSVVVNIVIPVACSDGLDNDGDGKIDYPTDTGCASATDDSEADPVITDTTAPTISNLSADSPRGDQLVVTWTTNEPATAQVEYGTDGNLGNATDEDPRYVTSHTVTISPLDRKTIYYVQVSSRDAAGNTRTSSIIGTYTVARLPKSPKVTELTASIGSIVLHWNNPTEYEFYAGTIVMRSDSDFILTPSRSTALVDTTGTTYTDTSAVVGTAYYYTVFTYDDEGVYSDPEFISFRILPGTITGTIGGGSAGSGISDYIAPLAPTGFAATHNTDDTVTLHWTNPTDSDFSRVRILRRAGGAPTNASGTDGSTIIYEGPVTAVSDAHTYAASIFYAIYALDLFGNISLPAVATPETTPTTSYNPDGSEISLESPICQRTVPGITIARWLVFGESGGDVRTLQEYLNKIGHTVASSGPGAPGEESDYFGALTERALKRFQCERLGVCSGNPTTTGHGGVGPRTRAVLSAGTTSNQCTDSGTPSPGLTSTSTPTQIEALRSRLLELQRQLQLLLSASS